MTLLRALIVAALACGCERGATVQPTVQPTAQPTTQPPSPSPQVAATPAAAAALAKTFAPEIVGTITPVAPVAGDYAMTLALDFETFVTTELRITDERKGALHLTLAPDGTAHACVGAIDHHASQGQYHYERDPAKRRHSDDREARLLALAGTWKIVDGVAVIALDRNAGGTCDASKAVTTIDTPVTELRCIGVTGSDRIPAGSLACEASERAQLLDLGMPMAAPSPARSSTERAPVGRQLVLGAPGVAVVVRDLYREAFAITFKADPAPLVEADYVTR